jgi:uncharacterized protein
MPQLTLSIRAARALHLAAQGLLSPPRKKALKADLLAAIRTMGVLQIDTISVVARSPYFVLWSRLGAYQQVWLEELLAEGALFEYWAHEACFVPIEDYGWYRHRMKDPASLGWKYAAKFIEEEAALVASVLAHIRANGPTRSADFERNDGKSGGWWDWKPEKRSLEVLFTTGHLMVARRQSFHRVYDLTERVLPDWDDAHMPSLAQTQRDLLLKAVKALGLAKADWIGDYFRNGKTRPRPELANMLEEGALIQIAVEGWDVPFYLHPDHLPLAQAAADGVLKSTVTTLLSPFDPVVWDRRRASELFGFDYKIECYTPEAKRRYGYFTLPILRAGALVGRVDAKAHRKEGVFEVKALHLEAGVRVTSALAQDVADALVRCAQWHTCPSLRVTRTDPATLAPLLRAALGCE